MDIEKLKFKLDFKNPRDTFFLGSGTGVLGIGLQNLNPFEPVDITHWIAVFVGLTFPIMYLLILNLVISCKNLVKLIKNKNFKK